MGGRGSAGVVGEGEGAEAVTHDCGDPNCDGAPLERLRWLYAHCLEVRVECNVHRSLYEPIEESVAMERATEEQKAAILAKGTVVEIVVYPETPVAFESVVDVDLSAAIDRIYEIVRARFDRRKAEEDAGGELT